MLDWVSLYSRNLFYLFRHSCEHLLTRYFNVTSTAVENTWERRLDVLNFDDIEHRCRTYHVSWMKNHFVSRTTISKKAYVLLPVWFPTRGACRGRDRFRCTASTWWVWQRAPHQTSTSSLVYFFYQCRGCWHLLICGHMHVWFSPISRMR